MDEYTSDVFAASSLNKIQVALEMLRRDLGAIGVMLLDEYGHLLLERGKHGDYDVNTFLALLANAMSASNAVINLLHDKSAFDLHIHEGTTFEMYTSRINDRVFLCLTLEKRSGSSRVGMVWITLRRAVAELRELIEQATIQPGTPEDQEIQNAISGTLTEALDQLESSMPAGKSVDSTIQAAMPAEENTHPDLPKEDLTNNPADDPREDAPSDLTQDDITDPDRKFTYEEARRLGLINLDNLNRDSG